jgi:hypothetical protein
MSLASIAQEQADIQRAKAKNLLNAALGFTESGNVDSLVDCIISAALLEMVVLHDGAAREARANKASSDNP